jgi:hypothetical protein
MLDINANHLPVLVKIDHQAVLNFPRIDAWLRIEIDIQGICFPIIVQLHRSPYGPEGGLKFLSGNALWTVSPSDSVTTHKHLPPNSVRLNGFRNRVLDYALAPF